MSNMKKVQSRGKPSQAISKSLSALMDIDTDVIYVLSDAERDKLSVQLSKLNNAVTKLNEFCTDDVPFEETEEETAEAPAAAAGPLLGAADWRLPIVYCSNADKAITNLTFSLSFGAFCYSDMQDREVRIRMRFTDADGKPLSDETEMLITAGSTPKAAFTLYDRASALQECRLIIFYAEHDPCEALMMLRFRINMAFGVEFGF